MIEDEIIKIPTANVIEVIRCKDCKKWNDIKFLKIKGEVYYD